MQKSDEIVEIIRAVFNGYVSSLSTDLVPTITDTLSVHILVNCYNEKDGFRKKYPR